MLGVDDGKDTGDRLPQVVAVDYFCVSIDFPCFTMPSRHNLRWGRERGSRGKHHFGVSHLVELAAGGGNLLDAKLAELSLELAELLHQIILALVPQLDRLDLARRLSTTCQQLLSPPNVMCVSVCGCVWS